MEEQKDDKAHEEVPTLAVVELNRRTVELRKMHATGTRTIKNGMKLEMAHVFGLPNVERNPFMMFYSEDDKQKAKGELLVVPTGRNFVGYSVKDLSIHFIKGDIENPVVTAMAFTTVKGLQAIALAEKQIVDYGGNIREARVVIYIPRKERRKILSHRHLGTDKEVEIIQIAFSSNPPKYCLTLARVGKNMLMASYYIWGKEALILSKQIDSKVRHIVFNPTDEAEFVACGNKYLRYYVIKEGKMKEGTEIKRSEERVNNYIDAKFFPNTPIFLAISDRLMGYIIEDSIVKYKLSLDQSSMAPPVIDEKLEDSAEETEHKDENESESIVEEKKKIEIEPIKKDDRKMKKPIPQCLAVGAKRFAVGWKYQGLVGLYEIHLKDPEHMEILLTKVFSIGEEFYDIISVEFNASQEQLAVAGRRPLLVKNENDDPTSIINTMDEHMVTECYLVNVPEIEAIQTKSTLPFRQIVDKGNPYGSIVSVSVALLKRIIATIGTDKFIRIWDFSDGKFRQIVNTYFESQLNDVSIHPSGLQLAAGANEGIRIFFVLEEEVKLALDISGKQCMAVQYSYGGHWLAAGFSYQVFLIDPYTFETKFALGPHRSTVTRLSWTPNDYYLVSSCRSGTAFVWSSRFEIYKPETQSVVALSQPEADSGHSKLSASNKYEFVRQNIQFTGSAYDDEYDLMVIVSIDRAMEILSEKGNTMYRHFKFEEPLIPTCLLLCKESQVLLVGTNIGIIRAFLWPPPPQDFPHLDFEFHDFKIHAGEVTGMELAEDGNYIISSGKDGKIIVLKSGEVWDSNSATGSTQGPDKKRKLKKEQGAGGVRAKFHESMDSLSVTYRNALRDKLARIARLKEDKKSEEEMAVEKQNLLRKELEKTMQELTDSHVKALDEQRESYKMLQFQYDTEVRKAENERIRLIAEHHRAMEEIDEKHKKEQRIAFDITNEKVELLEQQKAEFREEIDRIQNNLKDQLEKIESTYQAKYDELKAQHNELLKKLKIDGVRFDEGLEQCEQEYEKEIENMKKSYYTDLKISRDNNEEAKKQLDDTEKQLKETKKKMEDAIKEKEYNQERVKELLTSKTLLEIKVKESEEQLKQRELIIREKEKEIQTLRNTNTHLENFRFVLDHKIISLKDEKLPMEDQIKNLESQVNEMYQELEKGANYIQLLKANSEKLSKELENAKVQIKTHSQQVHNAKRKLELLQYDLINVFKEPVDSWPAVLMKVYNAYFAKDDSLKIHVPEFMALKKGEVLKMDIEEPRGKKHEETTRVRDELVMHKEWLESKLKAVRRDGDKRDQEKSNAIKKLQKQNTELINDANKLRRDYDTLKTKVRQLEDKFKELTGISLTNVQDIEKEIKKFIHPGMVKSATHRSATTGFGVPKKQPQMTKNPSSILQYNNTMVKSGEEAKGDIGHLIGDLQKNKQVMEQQNVEMAKLQEKVSQFLVSEQKSPDSTLPPISRSVVQQSIDTDQTYDATKFRAHEESTIPIKNASMESLSSSLTRDLSKKNIPNQQFAGTSKHFQPQLPKKRSL